VSICLKVLSLLELLGLLAAVGFGSAARVLSAGVDLLCLLALENTFIVGFKL